MEQDTAPVPVGKKGLASHKKMEKEKEKEREKEREREKEKSKEASFFLFMPDFSNLSFNHSIHLSLFKLNTCSADDKFVRGPMFMLLFRISFLNLLYARSLM